ncbi:TPA: hypothetical protein K8N06_003141 [Clostridium perfringens]|nr:hypothetical protein [Clostridium perfringens]
MKLWKSIKLKSNLKSLPNDSREPILKVLDKDILNKSPSIQGALLVNVYHLLSLKVITTLILIWLVIKKDLKVLYKNPNIFLSGLDELRDF